MGTEFKQLEARLSPLGEALAALEAGAGRPDVDIHAVAAWLAHAAEVEAEVACLLLSNVHKFPEERGFSSLRLRNQLIHRHVAARHGGFELLRALGFALRDADSEEPLLLLEEPDVQQQYEEWAAWYERLKANIATLEAELRVLRIAVLPTAVKGGQYGVDLPSSGRRNGPQVATLHGSSGGTT